MITNLEMPFSHYDLRKGRSTRLVRSCSTPFFVVRAARISNLKIQPIATFFGAFKHLCDFVNTCKIVCDLWLANVRRTNCGKLLGLVELPTSRLILFLGLLVTRNGSRASLVPSQEAISCRCNRRNERPSRMRRLGFQFDDDISADRAEFYFWQRGIVRRVMEKFRRMGDVYLQNFLCIYRSFAWC